MGRQKAASRRMGLGAIVVLLCCVGAAYAQGGSVVSVVDEDGMMRDIVNLEPDQRRIESRQWAAVEWSLPLRSDPDLNPYDTLQIVVDVVLTAPSGAQLTVPAFWYEGFERSREGDAEVLTPTGVAEWRVRFTPTEAGEYSSEVHVGVPALGHAEAPGPTLEVAAALGRGFIRVNDANRRYFVFDDGTPYFALGHNVCWPNAVSITWALTGSPALSTGMRLRALTMHIERPSITRETLSATSSQPSHGGPISLWAATVTGRPSGATPSAALR